MRISTAFLIALVPASAAASSTSKYPPPWIPRGGASTKTKQDVRKYRMEQQQLMQLRSMILSEELAKRGIPIPTLQDVSVPNDQKKPEKVDWDCAMATEDEPKSCMLSFDAEANTKVLAPIDSDDWISVSALNRLRRNDPTKVDPMWHSKFAIVESWFSPSSPYALSSSLASRPSTLLLSFVLDHKWALSLSIVGSLFTLVILFLPVLEVLAQRLLVSDFLWMEWPKWARYVHAALPLKMLIVQMSFKYAMQALGKLQNRIRATLIEIESQALEDALPLTVGPGSDVIEMDLTSEAMDGGEGGGEGGEEESESEDDDDDDYVDDEDDDDWGEEEGEF
eukprot:CAMPEP_0194035168 /NCGR_PEP_ID=MMETSP0009_2-20130614/7622_1 /TAXON_ID=210454 /ORGANISM="Grammatophora oceanica, Strain CCMP 410" /LENGTH=336 /DNA_ID=CAMNT_0038676423 /DNA_START=6 /DNA_END=1016 /DNA_ORIENTATION=-